MINGMTILEQTPIKAVATWTNVLFIVGIVIMIIGLITSIILTRNVGNDYMALSDKRLKPMYVGISLGFIIVITGMILPGSKYETGRYKYKCTFENYVTVNDITEVYEITDVNGDIWTVEDKNIEVR